MREKREGQQRLKTETERSTHPHVGHVGPGLAILGGAAVGPGHCAAHEGRAHRLGAHDGVRDMVGELNVQDTALDVEAGLVGERVCHLQ